MNMRRRTFLGATGLVASSPRALAAAAREPSDPRSPMKTRDLNAYLRARIAVEEPSVDRITFGDPETVVRRIGTAWMPYWKTCRAAVAAGVNVLVVHEPAFYTHWDLDEKDGRDFYSAPEAGRKAFEKARDEKRAWLEANGLVLIRCHDVLDRLPEIGIPHAFGRLLGLEAKDLLRSKRFYDVLAVEPAPAAAVAGRLAERLRAVGQPGVAFYGDPERVVRSIGVGTGCICDPLESMELAPDLFVGIDDTIRTWIQTTWAEDTGRPLVVVNHGASEEAGMRALSEHLRGAFPDKRVVHFPQGCGYRWIS
jgi:putative NIF3 family GTP cyclohydrolase 1 type 2